MSASATPKLAIPDESVDAWLAMLKPYQRDHLAAFIASGKSPEEAAEYWLSARGAEGTIGFGGAGGSQPFFDRFKAEFKRFLCGDNAYDDERTKLLSKADAAKTTIISTVSIAIAANLGTSAALLVPPVALMLQVVGKIGLRAWCSDGGSIGNGS